MTKTARHPGVNNALYTRDRSGQVEGGQDAELTDALAGLVRSNFSWKH